MECVILKAKRRNSWSSSSSRSSTEHLKQTILAELEAASLEVVLSKVMPLDVLERFKRKFQEETFARTQELRTEVQSWVEIAIDNLGHKQMFINFPRFNTSQIRAAFSPQLNLAHQFKSTQEMDAFVSTTLYDLIVPLIDDEFYFLEQISEILRRIVTGEALSDSQKHIFSMEQPFQSPPDLQLSSAHSAQSMCEITVGELTEEQKDSEVLSCCSVNIPPFDIDPIGTKHQNM
jgi:hypothetical protein